MKSLKNFLSLIVITASVYSCTSDEPKQEGVANQKATPVSKLPEPFRFAKAIEVKPGLTFDVLSWGRGSEMIGAYLILRSDSSKLRYRSTSGELEGRVVDAWNMDMDSDGNPEIFIQSAGDQKGSFLNMYVFEFNDSGSPQELTFPQLSSRLRKNYQGKDSIYIKEGLLRREFPLYDEADTAGLTPTGRKILEYEFRGNRFVVDEIEDEQENQ